MENRRWKNEECEPDKSRCEEKTGKQRKKGEKKPIKSIQKSNSTPSGEFCVKIQLRKHHMALGRDHFSLSESNQSSKSIPQPVIPLRQT